jgi:hypothetical protein
MPANIEILLDWPEVRISTSELNEREIVILVESTREWAICHNCGEKSGSFIAMGGCCVCAICRFLSEGMIVEIRMWPRSLKASLQEEEYEAFKGTLKSSGCFLSV